MGFYSGSSTGPNDLIDKFRIAALAESWTVNNFSADGTGYRLHIQKTASDSTVMYFNLRSAIDEKITEDGDATDGKVTGLGVNGSTGFDIGESWDQQPGYPENIDYNDYAFANVMTAMSTTAIPAYYFFFNGDSVHIVVETTAGKFQFMSFGLFVKQGTFTGGQYFTASFQSRFCADIYDSGSYAPHYFTWNHYGNINGAVYLNADGTADWRCANYNSKEIMFPCVAGQQGSEEDSKRGLASFFWAFSPNSYNAMAAMVPIYVLLLRSDDNYSLLGWPEGVRFLNCSGYSAAEEVTYGAETWMIFHADSQAPDPLNMYCGFAFLKDV